MKGLPTTIDRIDQCLPQTQCTLCGYPRCREYASAIAARKADINQCPPGGDVTISALAKLLDQPRLPLNENHGVHEKKQVVFIREAECIGCRLCIKACPVDCIVGANKVMHTVIAEQCTGCKLCLPVCPTDCIELLPAERFEGTASPWPEFTSQQVERARRDTGLKLDRDARRKTRPSPGKRLSDRNRLKQGILAAVHRKTRSSDLP
ncbi:MAG: RnfABCDGE type electron transport complex subunit B [Gammaproteobacteria bacterium]|nr:RnfABCDGE type electron transport complex subunit B [Gammaproteobacteria bacterium]MYD76544.1 RnfABCDGE type electron transport complex subunit B [Gammaproteobacteria bacterium]MYJ52014.1 RnfABCDGE type electron transport complex subunit B [Gammaproteobacteria bacterium]